MKRYNIIGNCYQNISTLVNEKMFYTPKKGQQKTIEVNEIPKALKDLADQNLIIIREIK